MRRATGLAALAAAMALVGCGTSDRAQPSRGRSLFAQDCGACHSLSGRRTPRRQGDDLLDLQVERAAMLEFVREMPVRHRLSSNDQQAVANYLIEVERSASHG